MSSSGRLLGILRQTLATWNLIIHVKNVLYFSSVNEKRYFLLFQGEYRLQMEAQRISLSQIHAAQLEVLQEETDARTHSLELKLKNLKDHGDQGEQTCSRLPFSVPQRGFWFIIHDGSTLNRILPCCDYPWFCTCWLLCVRQRTYWSLFNNLISHEWNISCLISFRRAKNLQIPQHVTGCVNRMQWDHSGNSWKQTVFFVFFLWICQVYEGCNLVCCLFGVQCFKKMFGEEFLESVDEDSQPPPLADRHETKESTTIVLEARGNLSV